MTLDATPLAGASAHPAPQRHAARMTALWFGLFGAPLAWSAQLLVGYALAAHSCYPAREPLARPALGGLPALEAAVSAMAALVALAAGLVALRSWAATRGESGHGTGAMLEVGEGRTHFMAFSGVLMSALFLLGIVLNGVSLFLLPPCAR